MVLECVSATRSGRGQDVMIGGVVYSASDLLVRMALNFEDSRAIDVAALPEGLFVFRYQDGQDQRIVTLLLDSSFRILAEERDWFPEWNGDGECWAQHCGH